MIKRDMRVLWALGLGLLMLAGCGDDSGRGIDSGTARDSSVVDSGVTLMDGSMIDTGTAPPIDSGMDTGMTPPTDGGTGMCPSGACDILSNVGCGTGEGCYFAASAPDAGPAPVCAMAGTAGDGAACTGLQDCQEGFLCDMAAGVCRHYCCGGSDTGCPLGQRCAISIVDGAGMTTGVGICRLPDTCDLLAQTGCPAGESCYPNGDGVICGASSDGVTEGGACMFANTCAGGLICVNMPGMCAKLCDRDMAGGPTCGSGQTCGGVTGLPANVGVCTPPAGG